MADNGIGYSPLFVGLTDAEVETLLAAAEERSYGDGELIVDQNTPSDCLFILADSAVQVEHREGARSIPLARLDQSCEFFGEMSPSISSRDQPIFVPAGQRWFSPSRSKL
ncbi:MAG: hypothetical protein CME05_12840 [Gemmatimonadaceae bacterium]|nr:hypothetical protein [Gemmatimonadaceae bacterium]